MNYKVHKDFQDIEAEFLKVDDYFGQRGKLIFHDRNTLKKIPLGKYNVVIKQYRKPHLINQFAYAYIRPSKAQRAYENALQLLKMGINTPVPVGYIEHKNVIGLQRAYLGTLHFEHVCEIREVIHTTDYENREAILRAFAQYSIELQNKNVYFLDHSPGNTLLTIEADGSYSFTLVDVNRMKFEPLHLAQRYENFSKLTPMEEVYRIFAEELAAFLSKDVEEVFQEIHNRVVRDQQSRQRRKKLKQVRNKALLKNK